MKTETRQAISINLEEGVTVTGDFFLDGIEEILNAIKDNEDGMDNISITNDGDMVEVILYIDTAKNDKTYFITIDSYDWYSGDEDIYAWAEKQITSIKNHIEFLESNLI